MLYRLCTIPLLLNLITVYCQQPVMVVGQTAGMRVYDMVPDKYLQCSIPHTSPYGCNGGFTLYIDTPFINYFVFTYSEGECGGAGYRMYQNLLNAFGDLEVLMDTSDSGLYFVPPVFYGDSIFDNENSGEDFTVTFIPDTAPPYGYLDTTYFLNHYAWLDSSAHPMQNFSWWGNCLGGSPYKGWVDYGDTTLYLIFRRAVPADTLYGWIEIHSAYGQLTFKQFALGGGTGNFIYNNVPTVENVPEISLHPNPATNVLRLECAWPDFNWQVLSVDGEQLMWAPTKVEEIDLYQFTSGVYLLRISNNGHSVIKRFIKE